MPTLPPPADPQPHRHRDVAESFGSDAERYDRARLRYPQALIDRIAAAGPDVVNVGCGTGIEARQLRAAGCKVLGVEPDPRMAGFARRTGVEVEVSTFEAWDPAGRTFDAVAAGTSWHWVDPAVGVPKAAEVLRPGGLLAAFWHAFQLPAEIAEAFAEVYHRVVPDSPFVLNAVRDGMETYQLMCAKAADGIRSAGGFGEPEQWRFDWEHTYTRAEFLDQLPTQGMLTKVSPEQVAAVQEGVGAAIDALGGNFTMPYATLAVAAVRVST